MASSLRCARPTALVYDAIKVAVRSSSKQPKMFLNVSWSIRFVLLQTQLVVQCRNGTHTSWLACRVERTDVVNDAQGQEKKFSYRTAPTVKTFRRVSGWLNLDPPHCQRKNGPFQEQLFLFLIRRTALCAPSERNGTDADASWRQCHTVELSWVKFFFFFIFVFLFGQRRGQILISVFSRRSAPRSDDAPNEFRRDPPRTWTVSRRLGRLVKNSILFCVCSFYLFFYF